MTKKIPTFFINGIMDAGKTSFITETIKTDGFNQPTLLIVCEEGETEYDAKMLKFEHNTDIVYYEDQESFTYQSIQEKIDEFKPKRIVIEMNGMWDLSKLQFPQCMDLVQVIAFVDATTFPIYFNNMRQKMVEIVQKAQLVVFTHVTDASKQLEPFKTPLKMANSQGAFYIMDEKFVATDAFEEPLPYDVEADVIDVKRDDFATFYIDTFDHKERYEGKVVEYDNQIFFSDKLPAGTFIAGRKVMNCCANDVQLCGFLVKSKMGLDLKDRSWIHIKAKLVYEFSKEYNEEECMLEPIEIKVIEAPKEDVLNLSGNPQ
jgi:hypothetical protein